MRNIPGWLYIIRFAMSEDWLACPLASQRQPPRRSMDRIHRNGSDTWASLVLRTWYFPTFRHRASSIASVRCISRRDSCSRLLRTPRTRIVKQPITPWAKRCRTSWGRFRASRSRRGNSGQPRCSATALSARCAKTTCLAPSAGVASRETPATTECRPPSLTVNCATRSPCALGALGGGCRRNASQAGTGTHDRAPPASWRCQALRRRCGPRL
jgi:hypothetical protein